MAKGLAITAPTIERGTQFKVGQLAAPELPVQADALSAQMQDIARSYLGARRQSGVSLLEAARWLSEAKEAAKHGEWAIFLEAIGLDDSRARAQIRIHEEAMRNPLFADRIINGFLSETVARELLPLPAETREELLARETPPTAADVREAKRVLTPVLETTPMLVADPTVEAEIKRLCAICNVRYMGVAADRPVFDGVRYRIFYGEHPPYLGGGDFLAAEALEKLQAMCNAKQLSATPDFDAAHERARVLGYKLSTWGGWWRLASADDLHRDAAPIADVLMQIDQLEAAAKRKAIEAQVTMPDSSNQRPNAPAGWAWTGESALFCLADTVVIRPRLTYQGTITEAEQHDRIRAEMAAERAAPTDRVVGQRADPNKPDPKEPPAPTFDRSIGRASSSFTSAEYDEWAETDQILLDKAANAIRRNDMDVAETLLSQVVVKTAVRDALWAQITPPPDPRDQAIRLYAQLAPLLLQIKPEDGEALSMAIANLNECREGTEGEHVNGVLRAYLDLEAD